MKRICAFLIILWSLSGFAESLGVKDDISVTLDQKLVQDLSSSGLTLAFYVNIKNSSSKTYNLSRYSYRFVINKTKYLQLQTPLEPGLKIEPSKSTLISLPVKITYRLLFQTVPETKNQARSQCHLTGNLFFSEGKKEKGSIAFSFPGEFPIFKDPEIELSSINLASLTIGGSDLGLEVKFKNNNTFELFVDRISYDLKFGGHPIDIGKIGGDKNIDSFGEKIFTIPQLLNFFEVGKDVYALLQQETVNCRFTGEYVLKTVWGRLTIPFDVTQKVPVKNKAPSLREV